MKKLFEGSGVALVTPFKDGKVNYEKLGELIEWHIANKTDAIIVCGTTGESATMTDEERKNRNDGHTSAIELFVNWYQDIYLKQDVK